MDAQWLKIQFLNNPEKNKSDLARALGLEPPAVSKILANSRQIKAKEYAIMRRFFGLPVEEQTSPLIYRAPNNPSSQNLRDTSTQKMQWKIPANVIQKRMQIDASALKIMDVTENFMSPDFILGEHILIDQSDIIPTPPGVFMLTDGYSMMLRFCESKSDTEMKISANHESFHPHSVPIKNVKILGRVIAKIQWI